MRVVIVGGSAAGLFTGLLLARTGHEVLVIDRDDVSPHTDVDEAATFALRAGAPHVVQPHALIARCRALLALELPDVYDALLAAGAHEAPYRAQLPTPLAGQPREPGDEALTMLMTRRSTLDWALRCAAQREPRLTVRGGVKATGLLSQPGTTARVTGVMTSAGPCPADVVVDAAGRRTPIDRWLQEIDAPPTTTRRAECGFAMYSRHYRLREDAQPPGPQSTRLIAPLDQFYAGIWGGDGRSMVLAVGCLSADKRFGTAASAAGFEAVLRAVPYFAAWLEALTPSSPVFAIGSLHNTLRRFEAAGAEVAHGLLAVGDSVCTTNPTMGRGLALALQGARDLRDVLADHDGDWSATSRRWHERVDTGIQPYFEDQTANDRDLLDVYRARVLGVPPQARSPRADRVSFLQLSAAAPYDAFVHRAMSRVLAMVTTPEDVYRDAVVVARTHAVLARPGFRPARLDQPTAEELEAILAGPVPVATR